MEIDENISRLFPIGVRYRVIITNLINAKEYLFVLFMLKQSNIEISIFYLGIPSG